MHRLVRGRAALAGFSFSLAALAVESGSVAVAAPAPPAIELINNQPFPIRMPVRIRLAGNETAAATNIGQRIGDDLVLIADVPPGARTRVVAAPSDSRSKSNFSVAPAADGMQLRYAGRDLGRLSWDIVVKPAKEIPAPDAAGSAPPDLAAGFTPLPLKFQRTTTGAVCDVWTAEALKSGLRLHLEVLAFADGLLDLNAQLTNESALQPTGVYAAVVARWQQPQVTSRVLCADNCVAPIGAHEWSAFRHGEGRHLFTQRGVDWIETAFAENGAAAWLNDFAPSFTLLDSSSKNTFQQPRYFGANVPQLGQEVQTVGDQLFSVTEIARSNIRSYRDRLAENVLPARGEGVTFSSRLMFAAGALAPAQVDQAFVGYTSYNEQRGTPAGIEISFGVASVRFGTAYFPYSTFGENFDVLKLPGMDRESFWPLAADTVLRWRDFADDIRRDLRLIKSMGFQLVRLHHLELLAPIPAAIRREYLDFIFAELRHIQLRAMLDVYASPESIAEVVARYADVIDAVELENEILIWGIPLDRPDQWRKTYEAIKRVAPHVRVHLTGYNNTGIFNRLDALGVPYDRVGLHSYVDSLEALPTARGYALALGSFASKAGKPPVITEWNWRGLTRLTPEARAAIYPAIFDNALSTRAVPEIHQFQFQETMTPNPRVGRGNILRHYELVHLSRRLKPEAFELLKLIRKYAAPDDPVRVLDVPPVVATLDRNGSGTARVQIMNDGAAPVRLRLAVELGPGFTARLGGANEIELAPGKSATVRVELEARGATPGFYHAFVRIESASKPVRYAVIEARLAGRPKLDTSAAPVIAGVTYPQGVANALDLDFSRRCVIVYGQDAPVLEVETAIAIAETLESAMGQPVEALQVGDATAARQKAGTVILVGTPRADPLIAELATKLKVGRGGFVARASSPASAATLVIGGDKSEAVEHAGMDFLLRYWKFAKDSAARRVGVEKKDLPRGVDATKLP